jgi:hypothetical protein
MICFTLSRFPAFTSANHAVNNLGEAVVALEADRPSEPPASWDFATEDVKGQHLALALHLDQTSLLDNVATLAQDLEFKNCHLRISIVWFSLKDHQWRIVT